MNAKVIIFLFLIVLSFNQSMACDKFLMKYRRECEFQNRYNKLKVKYLDLKIPIEEITEYRALRFIALRDFKPNKGLYYIPWDYYGQNVWIKWEEGNEYRKEVMSKKYRCQIKRS